MIAFSVTRRTGSRPGWQTTMTTTEGDGSTDQPLSLTLSVLPDKRTAIADAFGAAKTVNGSMYVEDIDADMSHLLGVAGIDLLSEIPAHTRRFIDAIAANERNL